MSDEKTTQIATLMDRLLENPALLESLSSLLRDAPSNHEADTVAPGASENEDSVPTATQKESSTEAEAEPVIGDAHTPSVSERRHRLLCAIKPYVSPSRAKALESIEAIAELMELFKHA